MDRVIGGAARRQQPDDAVDDRPLVNHFVHWNVLIAQCGNRSAALRSGGGQRIPQRRIRIDERRARQMQPHHLHQHLIAVGRAVERAGARTVIGLHLRVQQLTPAHLAFGIKLADTRFLGIGQPRGHRPAWYENRRQMPKLQGADQQTRHDLVADAQAQHAIEHVVRQGNRRGHRNHVAREQRQFHAGLPLSHAIAHRRNATGKLRHRPGLAGGLLDQLREPLQRLMGGQHVVVRRDDRQIRPLRTAQRILVIRLRGRERMRQIGTGNLMPGGARLGRRTPMAQVIGPTRGATFPDALGDTDQGSMRGHIESLLFTDPGSPEPRRSGIPGWAARGPRPSGM